MCNWLLLFACGKWLTVFCETTEEAEEMGHQVTRLSSEALLTKVICLG